MTLAKEEAAAMFHVDRNLAPTPPRRLSCPISISDDEDEPPRASKAWRRSSSLSLFVRASCSVPVTMLDVLSWRPTLPWRNGACTAHPLTASPRSSKNVGPLPPLSLPPPLPPLPPLPLTLPLPLPPPPSVPFLSDAPVGCLSACPSCIPRTRPSHFAALRRSPPAQLATPVQYVA